MVTELCRTLQFLTREDYDEAIESDLSTSDDPAERRKNSKAIASILLLCADEVQIQISITLALS